MFMYLRGAFLVHSKLIDSSIFSLLPKSEYKNTEHKNDFPYKKILKSKIYVLNKISIYLISSLLFLPF